MNNKPDSDVKAARDASRRNRRRGFSLIELLLVLLVVALLFALLMPATRQARPAAHRTQCKNNLKQIGIALHNYADAWGAFPPAYTVDEYGNPLHSWRTLILPYVDQAPLYATIDLSKAWDDPANAKARETALAVYNCPSMAGPRTHTTYMAIVAPGGFFRPGEPRPLSDVTADPGQTLMVIEVEPEHAVHWMSPVDADQQRVLSFGPKSELAHSGGLHAAFVDGSVRFISADTPAAERRKWISITADGD